MKTLSIDLIHKIMYLILLPFNRITSAAYALKYWYDLVVKEIRNSIPRYKTPYRGRLNDLMELE